MHNGKYQCHIATSCTYHLASCPSCSTRAIQKKLTLNDFFFHFWRGGRGQESVPLAKKIQDRKRKRSRQKNKRGDRKGESNDSSEIPDRGRGSD